MTVYFVNPTLGQSPSGGVRKLFTFARHLLDDGMDAAVVHGVPGHVPDWFEPSAPIVYAPLRLRGDDLLAIPEFLGPKLLTAAPGIPRVSINQNVFNTFNNISDPKRHPYLTSPTLLGALVVSDHSIEYLTYGFPDLPVRRIHYGLDERLYRPPIDPPERRIGYMPRKRASVGAQVLGLLQTRGTIEGWDVVAIEGMSETEAAETLRTCALFLSLSESEGFGLPPAEAMACGCFVIGFTGIAGREFFNPRYSVAIDEGEVLPFAREVEKYVQGFDALQQHSLGQEGSQWIADRYSVGRERSDVAAFFREMLTRAGASRTLSSVLKPEDTWRFRPTRVRRAVDHVRRAIGAIIDGR